MFRTSLLMFLLPVIMGFPAVGWGQVNDHSQTMWPLVTTSAVNEGVDIEFTFNREGNTDFNPSETGTFTTVTPIGGFNVLTGDDADGRESAMTIWDGDKKGIGRVGTLNNSVVNANESIRSEIQNSADAGVSPQSAGTQTFWVLETINNDGDSVSGTRYSTPPPPPPPQVGTTERKHVGRWAQTNTEDDSIRNPFTICAGIYGVDVLQNCDDVRFGGHSDTASSPELTQLATFQETGHQALFDARGESDAAVLPTDIFSQTLNSTSDRTDEDDGDDGFHTRTDPETSTKSVKIERNEQPWISLQAFNAEVTGQRASKAEVTEGSRVFFFIDRSPNQPAMNVRIWLDYHSKIFSSEYLPTLSNQHLVQFTEGQTSATVSFDTHDDMLNEGDGMIRADLDLSPTAISNYRVDSESAWFRVVDDDIPEVTLSISTNSIVEGEEYSWFLERDCCTDFDLHVATYLEQVKFYPDDVWEDLVVSEPHNSRLDGPSLGGFIASGRTRQEWRRGPSITSELVGPQGGYQRRRLREFPADDFSGIPEKGDLTFSPRYTVSSTDWVRIDWVNSAPGVIITSVADYGFLVDEGDEILVSLFRYGGALNIIPNFASNVRVLIEQTGNYLADDQLGVRTVTISPGRARALLRIPTRNDDVALADGTVTITILEGSSTDRTEDTYELDSLYSQFLGRQPHTAMVTVANDDNGGVFISETMLEVEEGGSNEYTVVLDLQPTGTVTVTPSVSDGGSELVSVSGAMTFTADNWNIAQTVTVSAREDDVRSVETAEIRHDVSGADYDSVEADSVSITIIDNDAPRVSLTLSDTSIGENGGISTVTASLSYPSSAETLITVSVSPIFQAAAGDYALSSNRTLTIPAGQTASVGIVTITAVNNAIDSPDKIVQVRGNTSSPLGIAGPSEVTLTIQDDDLRGVTISETDLYLDEGGDGTYTVVLDSEPTAAVTVTPSRSSGDSDVTVSGPLTFTASNWNTAQTVTVSTAQDSDPDDDAAVIGHSVAGGDYADFVAESVTVTVNDDETASDSITLTAAPASLAESASATTITVTATLNGGTRDADTPVAVNVGSGTATSGADFTAVSDFTITIPANTQSQTGTFSLDPLQDTIDEPDETVAVVGSTTINGISITDTTVTITDDDSTPTVTLSLSDDPIGENGGETIVTATLSNPSSVQTTVTITVDPNSPATSSDYSISTNRVLTIAVGQTASVGTVTITAVDNDIDAPNKTVQVTGDAANVHGIADPSDVMLTIADDDVRGVTLSETDLDLDEGGDGTYTVVLDSKPTAPVTITPSRSSGDSDVSVSGPLTFTASNWDTAQTVTVNAAQDSDADDDTAVIDHSVAGGDYADFVAESITVTVNDDETASDSITLTAAPASLAESNSAATITVTATLNGGTRDADTPVAVNVGSGTATSGADFAAVSAFTITIPANTQSQTGTFSLDPIQDGIDEPDETIVVDGSTTVSGISITDTTVTITDEDSAPTVTLALSEDLIGEDGGETTVTATLSNPSSVQTTVTISVEPDSPATSVDYSISANKVLTIAAGQTASTGMVTITAVNNALDTPNKTVQVKGGASNPLGITDPSDVTLTIVDDDGIRLTEDQDNQPPSEVTLSVAPAEVGEGDGAAEITVSAALNGRPLTHSTPISVSVVSGTATSGTDFTAVSTFTLTITAGALSGTETFSFVPTSDTIDEPDETVVVGGLTSINGLTVNGTEFEIIDDDSTPAVTLALSDDPIGENGGETTVTALLSHASSEATTVTISVDPNSPATGADYSISTNRVLTIAAGQTASEGTVTITAADNDIDAPDKTVVVQGEATNPLGIADPSEVTLTITDDDMRGVTLSETDLDLEEGGDGTYTVVLDSEPTAAVTITLSRSSGDSDVSVSGSLTFTASNWNTAQTVTVNAAQDSDPDDDTAVIGHSVAGGDYADFVAESVTVTVNDDETASDSITLTAAPASLAESASATTITVTAALNGGTRDADTPVAVNVGSGTATSGADYAAVSAFTITIPANTPSQTGTFILDPIQDAIDEPDETVVVDGSTTVSGISVTDTMVTITDDDSAPAVTLSLSDDPIGENGGATTVTASLNHASSEATTVTISVDPNSPATSSDYSISTNRVLTIAAGQTASEGTVTITVADNDIDAPDKTVVVQGEATNPFGIADPSDVTLTITDDDARGVTLSETNLDLDEGGEGTYTVVLDSEPTAAVTVTPSRSSGDSDVSVSGPLTFTASNWNTAQTVTVNAAQDSDPDDDTAVIGHSVAGGDYTDFVAESVTVTVNDDETASDSITLTATPASLAESASATTVTVTAALNGGTRDADTPIAVNVGSGTATSGADFTAVNDFTITIPANTLSQTGTFSLDPIQDAIDEPDETVVVDGSTTVSGISITDTMVTITDDDSAPAVTLSLSDDPIGENGGETTVTATLSNPSSVQTTVTISVDPNSPAASSDYSIGSNQILTIAAGQTASAGTVTVTAADNDVDAADKTVKSEVAKHRTHSGSPIRSAVTLTITDDDARGVTLSETNLDLDEDGDGTYTVVLDSEPTAAGDGDAVAQQRRLGCNGLGFPHLHGLELEYGADCKGECRPGQRCGRRCRSDRPFGRGGRLHRLCGGIGNRHSQ